MNLLIQLFFIAINFCIIKAKDPFHYVTCGSLVKLANQDTDIRLHSHNVKYGKF